MCPSVNVIRLGQRQHWQPSLNCSLQGPSTTLSLIPTKLTNIHIPSHLLAWYSLCLRLLYIYYMHQTDEHAPLRIAFVGDMGTHDDAMRKLLAGIREQASLNTLHLCNTNLLLMQNPHLIIHLGDIYVSGSIKECDAFWRHYEKAFPDEKV